MIKINIIGSGVVGFATGKGFITKGFNVSFIDINATRVEELISQGYDAFTVENTNLIDYSGHDTVIHFLAVPTPTIDGHVNLQFLETASEEVAKLIAKNNKYNVVVTRSTLPPGTTKKLALRIESVSGKKVGSDFGLCMNPEYLRAYNAVEDFEKPWIVVIGALDDKSYAVLESVYKKFTNKIHRLTIEEAEFQKYVHNLYNATKISYFNEMRQIAKNLGLNSEKIFELVSMSAEAIWNPMYGVRDKGPYGGACLPKDTQGFYTWAVENGFNPIQLKATIDVNRNLEEKLK